MHTTIYGSTSFAFPRAPTHRKTGRLHVEIMAIADALEAGELREVEAGYIVAEEV